MHVYMKNGTQRRWLTDVHLRDGFCPCIGDQNDGLVYPPVARIEPAIWCKVLVLESISIDCDQRTVSWSTGSTTEDYDDKNSPNQYSINEECSGYDTEDELFDLARTIINKSGQECQRDSPDDDYKMCILRMLHCFVLPKVKLYKTDLEKVEMAKLIQYQHIETLDAKIKRHCMNLDECQEELEIKREHFLPLLEEMINNQQCSKQFINLLLDDVKQEECKIRTQIDRAQDEVESAKKHLEVEQNADSNGRLYQARESRNFLHNKLELLVTAREVLVNAQNEIPENLEVLPSVLIDDYIAKREAVQRLKADRSQFVQQKNCALSVREMLDEILNDIHTRGFAEANDADLLGARATDVLQHAWYPEWQKLSERVATIVYNPDHPIGISFASFCSEISAMCKELIDLGKLSSDCMMDANIQHFGIESNVRPEDQLGGSYDACSLNDFMVESYRNRLGDIKRKIFKHLADITGLLGEQFNNQGAEFQKKLRLAYEHCFYEKEHDFIECVYELAHHEHVANLETDIKRLKKLPIKLLKLPMKDEWWHEIFEQRVKIEELSSQVVGLENGCHFSDSEMGFDEDMEDDLDGLEIEFPFRLNSRKEQLADCVSVRSFFINTVRERSRTFNFELDSSEESDEEDGRDLTNSRKCGPHLSTSAPQNSKVSLGDLIDEWDTNEKPTRESLQRRQSKSYGEINHSNNSQSPTPELQKNDTFEDHFGPALQNMKDVFKVTSPVAKLKCLTASLRKIADKVSELRSREGVDSLSTAVTAEDLLPLLVLMMLQLEPFEAASLWPQLAMLEDLMAPFLTSGCHGWALVEFQMAQRILAQLCSEF